MQLNEQVDVPGNWPDHGLQLLLTFHGDSGVIRLRGDRELTKKKGSNTW